MPIIMITSTKGKAFDRIVFLGSISNFKNRKMAPRIAHKKTLTECLAHKVFKISWWQMLKLENKDKTHKLASKSNAIKPTHS